MTSSESGQVYSPQPAISGPAAVRPHVISAAAAPSPNRAVAMMLLLDVSRLRKVRPQSSTTRNRTRLPGAARAMAAARARPRTPPAQPRPKIGRRCTSRRNGSTSMRRASRLGVAMPEVETATMLSTRSAGTAARLRQSLAARRNSSTAW